MTILQGEWTIWLPQEFDVIEDDAAAIPAADSIGVQESLGR